MEAHVSAAGRINDRLRELSDDDIRADEQSLQREISRIIGELAQADVAYVIDRDGLPLLASNLYPARRDSDLTDRDYFQALRAPGRPDVHVSETFVGRFDGRFLFSVSRPRYGTGNTPAHADRFDGVITVAISPNVLAEGLQRLLAEPTDRFALVRTDGHLLSDTGGMAAPPPPLPRDRPFHAAVAGAGPDVFMAPSGAWTDEPALTALGRVAGLPIVALAIRPRSAIVTDWPEGFSSQLIFGVPATLTLLFLRTRVRRDQVRPAEHRHHAADSDQCGRGWGHGLRPLSPLARGS